MRGDQMKKSDVSTVEREYWIMVCIVAYLICGFVSNFIFTASLAKLFYNFGTTVNIQPSWWSSIALPITGAISVLYLLAALFFGIVFLTPLSMMRKQVKEEEVTEKEKG
jgi:TRAP-type C4-dicarboxylate transport system permease small subunit